MINATQQDTIDLTAINAEAVFDVQRLSKLSVSAKVKPGGWSGGVLTVQRQVGGGGWAAVSPAATISADGTEFGIDVTAAQSVRVYVSTAGGGGGVDVWFYGYDDTGG